MQEKTSNPIRKIRSLTSSFPIWFSLFSVCACATQPTPYDPQHPAAAWASACYPETTDGLKSWVFLRCTFSNRSTQRLLFPQTQVIRSESDLWRQPTASEWELLKQDLKARKKASGAPIFVGQGNGSLENFLGQALVFSGIWILRANSKTENFEAPGKEIQVEAGKEVEQVFVLRRESAGHPGFIVLRDPSGIFEMSVKIAKDPGANRQRPSIPESP